MGEGKGFGIYVAFTPADARRRLYVQGNEHQALANLLRPRVGQDKRAGLPVDLCDIHSAVLVVAPGTGEAELVNAKSEARPQRRSRVGQGARTSLS